MRSHLPGINGSIIPSSIDCAWELGKKHQQGKRSLVELLDYILFSIICPEIGKEERRVRSGK